MPAVTPPLSSHRAASAQFSLVRRQKRFGSSTNERIGGGGVIRVRVYTGRMIRLSFFFSSMELREIEIAGENLEWFGGMNFFKYKG